MLAAAAALPACAAEPMRLDRRAEIGGRVIDAATGAPIEGAVVLATWRTELPPNPAAVALGMMIGGHGGSTERIAYVREALTDRDGHFTLRAWSVTDQWLGTSVTSGSPIIKFFKPGYLPDAASLGMWTLGVSDGGVGAGLRGPRVMALYRPGNKPKGDVQNWGMPPPTVEQETLQTLRDLQNALETDAMDADSEGAQVESAARERVRKAQFNARRVVGEGLRRPAEANPRPEIGGRVIDAAMGAPIEGAVVVAIWWTELPPNPAALALGLAGIGGHGTVERRTVYMSEALTDRDGRFTIPSWSIAEQWRPGSVTSYSPSIQFFAPGYSPATAGLGGWTNGIVSPTSPGIRGPRQMALYRPGRTPRRDPGAGRDFSIAEPTLEEQHREELRRLHNFLDAGATEADDPGARANSAARERARAAQRHAREMVERELRKANGWD